MQVTCFAPGCSGITGENMIPGFAKPSSALRTVRERRLGHTTAKSWLQGDGTRMPRLEISPCFP